MNENINLCELLKDHEGETFYSPLFGKVKLFRIDDDNEKRYSITIEAIHKSNGVHEKFGFNEYGRYFDIYEDDECMIFPSKEQRDWRKWKEENKLKPKTWRGLLNTNNIETSYCEIRYETNEDFPYGVDNCGETKIEKAALALLKINQLVEFSYGGNPSLEEKTGCNVFWQFTIMDYNDYEIGIEECDDPATSLVVFHTYKQVKEFLSYPENLQLVKDLYMIP